MKTTPRQQEQSRGSAAGDTLNFRTNRSCTVTRIRVRATPGLTFSGDTPHMCSQLSLFDLRSSTPSEQLEKSGASNELRRTVLCIWKRRIRHFDSLSATSTAKSTDRSGARGGIADCNGRAALSSTKTAGCTSTHCYQRRLMTSTVLSLAMRGTSGGTESSAETKLSSRGRKPTLRATSASTSSKTE